MEQRGTGRRVIAISIKTSLAQSLYKIEDQDCYENIMELVRCFVEKVKPLKVILFGSFANNSYTEDSDYDFYLVVEDGRNISQTMD